MSTVELVSNASPDESTYLWECRGVDQLTLNNKISSLPFWFPSPKSKDHQFRMILLKGLAGSAAPPDSFSAILELIPPPPPPDTTAQETPYPGGCRVTVGLVRCDGAPAPSAALTRAGVLDADSPQLSFEGLCGAATLSDASLCLDGASLRLSVTITANVNVVAEQVTQSLTGLWSSLAASVGSVVAQTTRTYGAELRRLAEVSVIPAPSAAPAQDEAAADDAAGYVAPWDVIPSKWSTREEEWRELLTNTLPSDEDTFRSGPAELSQESKAALLHSGLNPRVVSEAVKFFDFDRDVHEGLLESAVIRSQRYHLVPARMREEDFWANYFWKVTCLGHCDNDEQVRVLLTVLNAPHPTTPRATSPAADASPSAGGAAAAEAACAAAVREAEEAARLLEEYVRETPDAALDEGLLRGTVATCAGHARHVAALRAQGVPSATAVELQRARMLLEAQIAAAEARLAPRPPHSEVLAADPAPQAAEEAAVTDGPAPEAEPSVSAAADTAVAAEQQHAPPTAPAATPPKPGASSPDGANTSAANSSRKVEFPKMPWEEEEDDDA